MADWLVLIWRASFHDCFCWFALRSPEIMYEKSSVFLWRPFVEWKQWWVPDEKQKKPFVFLSFISRIITLICYCCFISDNNWGAEWADVNLFCHDTGSMQGRVNFWGPVSLLTSKTKTSILKKTCCQSGKSNHLSLHHIEICLWKIHS